MENQYLKLIESQHETIKTLSMELAGLTNALGQLVVQAYNQPHIDRSNEMRDLETQLNEPDSSELGAIL